jgi:hypothetical protein
MSIIQMPEIIGLRHYWNHDSIRPGGVASVGDVITVPRLRQSAPDLPMRFDSIFMKRQTKNGSKATSEPYIIPRGLGGKRDFRINHGWHIQDLRKPSTTNEPTLQSQGDYTWQNRIANVVNAKRTGSLFLPLPGEYKLREGQVPRGGSVPVVTSAGGTENYVVGVPGKGFDTTVPKNSFNIPYVP